MMKELKEIRKKRTAVFTFGRFNPPTKGHEKLINKLIQVASQNDATPYVFVSQSQDPHKNPLLPEKKIKYLKMAIPEIARNIVDDPYIRTPFDAIKMLERKEYTDVIMVVGSDRVYEFNRTITPKQFDSFSIISAGERDPDSSTVSGASAEKMRKSVEQDNFSEFKRGAPTGISDRFVLQMFNDVKRAMTIHKLVESTKMLPDSLNIPRLSMPQIRRENIADFLADLKSQGVRVTMAELSVEELYPTQNEINLDKVKTKCEKFMNGECPKPFIVSKEGHILDGHHQLFALKALNPTELAKCFVVHLDIHSLLKLAHKFPKTTYKTIEQ
jgi:hypothetical protein